LPYNSSGGIINGGDWLPLVMIANSPPTANFTWTPQIPTTSDTIFFTDSSIDSDGSIVSWTWDFGDGNISYQQNPTHQYSHIGTYNVTLTVTDNDGANDSITKQMMVLSNDTIPPFISNIQTSPDPQEKGMAVNISCNVVDNVSVASVKVNITYPDGSSINASMINIASTDTYYYNTSYANEGIYYYFMDK